MQEPLKICMNATGLLSDFTGIGRYTFELSKAMLASPSVNPYFFYGGFWSNTLISRPPKTTSVLLPVIRKYLPYSYRIRQSIQQHRFEKSEHTNKADVYHEPSFIAFNTDRPTVITVHDISWVHNPELHPLERVRHMEKNFEKSINSADHLITDSEFVRSELIEFFSIPPQKVTSVHLAAANEFYATPKAELLAPLSKYNLVYQKYFLIVGTLEPRKNIQIALRAFLRLSPKIKRNFKLVHVGGNGWLTGIDRDLFDQAIRDKLLISLGFVSQQDLSKLYAGAYALLHPSIYEGFGLPVLEAMKSKVPVIAADNSSIPEIVGDAAILCSSDDEDAFYEAISMLIHYPIERDKLAKHSEHRAETFSWRKTAQETIKIYRTLKQ